MSNSHIHPTIERSLIPFCVRMKTDKSERGCRVEAVDSLTATKLGIAKLNIRDEEIPAHGLALSVEVSQ